MTEEQAVAALKEAGLNCIIGYSFESGYGKGNVCSVTNPDFVYDLDGDYATPGTYIALEISLGEYDGPIEEAEPYHSTGDYTTKKSKLEVPVPDGLSGSYTFSSYVLDDAAYTETVDDIKGVKSVTLDVNASDKDWVVVYAKNNNSKEKELIRYATYEFDYTAETWTLVGELNTEGLLGTMN